MTLHTSTLVSRRALLRGLGVLGAAGLVVACGSDDEAPPSIATDGQGGEPTDVRAEILDQLGANVALDLNLVLPAFEFVAGDDRRLVFGLATDDREFLSGLDVDVTVVRDDGLEIAHGPVRAQTHENFGALGVYSATVSYPGPGIYRVAAVTPDRAAVGAIQVRDPADSPVPQIGDDFPVVSTPTTDDPQDLAELCTQDPDCSMHDVALAEALDAGRPVVLTVATPAYCATAICGPVVQVVESVRHDADRDDVAWIHLEVFKDAGNTPVDAVSDLGLPSEPWVFFIGSDGVLADKLEGPTPDPLLREGLAAI